MRESATLARMGARVVATIVGGFLAGVFTRSFVPLTPADAAFFLLLGATAALFIFVDRSKLPHLTVLAIACVAFAGGVMRMESALQTGDPYVNAKLDSNVTIEGFVSAEPDVRDNSVRLTVDMTALVATGTTTVHGKILVVAPAHTDVRYGDGIRASGVLGLPEVFDTGAGRQFDYPMFLAKDGILYQLSFAKISATGANNGNPVQAAAIAVKRAYISGLGSVLSEPEAGLAGGITVGDKRSIGPELSKDFQRVSLIHMVVLSGYNITVVMNSVRWFLRLLPHSIQYGGIGAAVLFFVLMSGGAASAVRAGAMALIAVFARATGRVYLAGRILGVVAFAMVLYNPFTLAFDPSFQLSALATLGLILFTPFFSAHLGWLTERFGLREILASTLATQLAVLPLLLYQNGNLSLVSIPANLLALVPVPLAMLASFVAALGGMFFGSYAVLLALPASMLLAYIIGVARLFAALPFASVSVPAFSVWWVFAAYGVLTVVYAIIARRNAKQSGPAEGGAAV